MSALLVTASLILAPQSYLITGGTVLDGTGSAPKIEDVRIVDGQVSAVGKLTAQAGDSVIDAKGLYVSPGFIDAHSHADGALDKLESQLREGITTSVVGQDGGWDVPVAEAMQRAESAHPMINFAFFSGLGGVRAHVMGKNPLRKSTPSELRAMEQLVDHDMEAGAIGVSTGLEYNPGFYASRNELIALSKIAAQYGGMYISHVRDETNGVFDSFDELIDIAQKAKLPAQISHIKMGVASVWGKASKAVAMVNAARAKGLDITADIYPYIYWQSTIRVLTNSRDWANRQVWVDALKDVGGAAHVRLTSYTPDPNWVGKNLEQISAETKIEAPDLIMKIIDATADGKGKESVLVEAMIEPDVVTFLKQPWMMICSDGSGGGSHPRSAGSFPRILARYVRDQHVLSWPDAIRKMTGLPATRFKLKDRGFIKPGYAADVVIFDPNTIADKATPDHPTDMAVGVKHVFVNGRLEMLNGMLTDERSGQSLRRAR